MTKILDYVITNILYVMVIPIDLIWRLVLTITFSVQNHFLRFAFTNRVFSLISKLERRSRIVSCGLGKITFKLYWTTLGKQLGPKD